MNSFVYLTVTGGRTVFDSNERGAIFIAEKYFEVPENVGGYDPWQEKYIWNQLGLYNGLCASHIFIP